MVKVVVYKIRSRALSIKLIFYSTKSLFPCFFGIQGQSSPQEQKYLLKAIQNSFLIEVVKYVQKNADVDWKEGTVAVCLSNFSTTSLIEAARQAGPGILQVLIKEKAGPNLDVQYTVTSLDIALRRLSDARNDPELRGQALKILRILLNAGAQIKSAYDYAHKVQNSEFLQFIEKASKSW